MKEIILKIFFDPNISFSNPLRYLDSYKTILQSNLSIGFRIYVTS